MKAENGTGECTNKENDHFGRRGDYAGKIGSKKT